MENSLKIFFSSDLMFRLGKADGSIIEGNWQTEVNNITSLQVADPEQRSKLQKTLSELNPKFVATGHGPCVSV